ncbi:TPA: hypothetical protein ACGOTT_001679 [Streptococcus suis]
MQTIDTAAFVYFPSKFRVRIDVRFRFILRLSWERKKPPAFAEGFLKYNDSGWAAYPTSQVLSRVRQEPF